MTEPARPHPTDSRHPRVADHAQRYAATGGQDGHLWHGAPTLLLTTTGRRTQAPRRTALIYAPHADGFLVIASALGADQHPDWYLNLCHTPAAQAQILDTTLPVHSRTATPAERPQLWQQMTQVWPDYDRYQKRTERVLPIVLLLPR